MTLHQLEYIIAVDDHRHFAKAAGKSFVTQPTLSMMIRKLEDELGVKIFDRTQQPVVPTKEGVGIILRARQVLAEAERLKTYVKSLQDEVSGEVHLGIIPTLAPYLLPLFLKPFTEKYPRIKLYLKEMVTDEIITRLKTNELDMALLATPLFDEQLTEHPLFMEEFYAYATSSEKLPKRKYLQPTQIKRDRLWVLEEGHCLRNQVFNLCEFKDPNSKDNLHYEAGSIETLINLVDRHHGITIIPQLAIQNLKPAQRKNIHEFANPKPARQISLVVANTFPRTNLLKALQEEIMSRVPFDEMKKVKVAKPFAER